MADNKVGVKNLEQEISPRDRVENRVREQVKSLFEGAPLPNLIDVSVQTLQSVAVRKKLDEYDRMVASSPTETI